MSPPRPLARRSAPAALVFAATLCLGCSAGATQGKVSGTVRVGGAPLNGGLVIFTTPDGKKQGAGEIRRDGTYSAETVPVGEVTVTVSTALIEGMAKAALKGAPVGLPRGFKAVPAPKRYADRKTSDLRYTVRPGANTHHIDLSP